jgi:hypothetical protein
MTGSGEAYSWTLSLFLDKKELPVTVRRMSMRVHGRKKIFKFDGDRLLNPEAFVTPQFLWGKPFRRKKINSYHGCVFFIEMEEDYEGYLLVADKYYPHLGHHDFTLEYLETLLVVTYCFTQDAAESWALLEHHDAIVREFGRKRAEKEGILYTPEEYREHIRTIVTKHTPELARQPEVYVL